MSVRDMVSDAAPILASSAEVKCCVAALSSILHRRISRPSKPDILPDETWRIPMKNLILAAVAALSLGAAVVPAYAASTVAGDAKATRMQQTGSYGAE
jgi:hypothetical protein